MDSVSFQSPNKFHEELISLFKLGNFPVVFILEKTRLRRDLINTY